MHEDGNFYPAGTYGDHTHCGAGAGLGKYIKLTDAHIDPELNGIRNINIPWPTKGMGDADYLLAFQHIVMPVAYQFDPDLVISRSSIAQCSARSLTCSSCRWI